MEVEEQIMADVESSAAATAEAPSETTEEVTPAIGEPEVTVTEESASPKDDFYKSQYENLQKDYTRKSQRLAELEKTNEPEPKADKQEPWEKPDWQPKTWQEVFEAGKRATLREVSPLLTEVEQAKQQRELYAQAQSAAEAEIAAIKGKDPKANEEEIFKHANKYGFSSLSAAYQNMADMRGMEKSIEQRVLKNIKSREADGVGISSATAPQDNEPSYEDISSHKSIASAARAALRSIKGQ